MNKTNWVALEPEALENAMKLIGKDWMLITAKDDRNGRVNGMTASWGCLGVLWNKPVCVCFIRPQRHTYGLVEAQDRFSLAFFGEEHRAALRLCGRESGRDGDKLAAAGLTASELCGVSVINEARLVLICRKLYADDLKKDRFVDPALFAHYPQDDFHRMYVCEIEGAYRAAE